MIKRIAVADLQHGMYVTDPGSGWLGRAFLAPFLIESDQDIERLRQLGLQSVLVDRGKSVDHIVAGKISPPAEKSLPPQLQQFWRQLPYARVCFQSLSRAVTDVALDIRLRRRVNLSAINRVLEKTYRAISDGTDAWVYLARLNHENNYVINHSIVVAVYMIIFARSMGIQKSTVIELSRSVLMQDMGKYLLADDILNINGSLDDMQFNHVKRHVEHSLRIVAAAGECTEIMRLVISQHHERLDGKGYPLGLGAHEISKYGRMAAIVDVYTALVSDTAYRSAMTPDAAMRIMLGRAPESYDRKFLLQFVKAIGLYPVGSEVQLATGKTALVIGQTEQSQYPVTITGYKGGSDMQLAHDKVSASLPQSSDCLETLLAAANI